MSRYNNRIIAINDNASYSEIINKKDARHIRQFTSPELNDISLLDRGNLQRTSIFWKQNDRLWKLAAQYYNDPTLWWVIAWYNQKPTEAHFQIGDTVVIPSPIQKILEIFER